MVKPGLVLIWYQEAKIKEEDILHLICEVSYFYRNYRDKEGVRQQTLNSVETEI